MVYKLLSGRPFHFYIKKKKQKKHRDIERQAVCCKSQLFNERIRTIPPGIHENPTELALIIKYILLFKIFVQLMKISTIFRYSILALPLAICVTMDSLLALSVWVL